MSDTIQSPSSIVVTQNPSQTFDPKDVVAAAKGVIDGDGKGFMPLTDFHPNQPYEDWKGFLEKRHETLNQERARVLAEDPKTFFEEQARKLEAEKNRLGQQLESDFKARLSDLEKVYEDRLSDQTKYYSDRITRRDDEIDQWKDRFQKLEMESKSLSSRIIADSDQRLEENMRHYETRIADMERHGSELREILQAANQEAWLRSEHTCKHIQDIIQARASGKKVSEFLEIKNKCWEKWLIVIGIPIILFILIMFIIFILIDII